MEKFNSQAETHSKRPGPPRTSSPTHAETHSRAPGPPRTSSPKRGVCCNFATAYFFLFLNRLQAQAHSEPGSSPRGSRKDLFFLFINRLQAQAQAHATAAAYQVNATHYFIDSLENVGY